MSASIKTLITKRDTFLRRAKDALAVGLEAAQNPERLGFFVLRCSRIETESGAFDETHFRIVSSLPEADEAALATQDTIRVEYDNTYFEVMALLEKLSPPRRDTTSSLTDSAGRDRPTNIKLPKVSLPQFKGDFKSWPTFIDLFNSMVHQNRSLTNIERFQYLMSGLSGEPLTLLKSFSISGSNYNDAYDALVARYQSKRKLAFNYWEEIRSVALKSQTASELRRVLDTFNENLSMLRNLGLPVDQWDFVLFHTLLTKLNQKTRERFEVQHVSDDIPTYRMLSTFVENQCRALELSKSESSTIVEERSRSKPSHYASLVVKAADTNIRCPLCEGQSHSLSSCDQFLAKSPQDRYSVARESKACLNCLRFNHSIKDCNSRYNCSKCRIRHHTLLHFGERNAEMCTPHDGAGPDSSTGSPPPPEPSASDVVRVLTNTLSGKSVVLLATVQLEVLDSRGRYITVRALLDSGSQANFITRRCVQRLGLRSTKTSTPVFGLGEASALTSNTVSCTIRSKQPTSTATPMMDAFVLPKICGHLPSAAISSHALEHLCQLNLADPKYHTPGGIDVLLGAEEFVRSLLPGRIEGTAGEPTAINTTYGWVLMGRVGCRASTTVNSFFVSTENSLEETVKKFWELEEVPSRLHLDMDNDPCEKHFQTTHSRDSSGRFTVSLPFSEPDPSFIGSRSVALRRFLSLEKRLLCDPDLYHSYCDFMRDYLNSNHMEPVDNEPVDSNRCYYIPHHCVIKQDNDSTKLRVVFDASAKTLHSHSLNETLLVGPKLQNDIVSIVFKFRFHAVAFTADVRQMYRQILVVEKHRDYQRILWRFSPYDPIQEFRLNTVTYGVSSSPFLALRTLKQLASDHKDIYPVAANIVNTDVYVDDIVTGADSIEAAADLQSQVIGLLGRGCLELRKWASSHPKLLENVDPNHCHPKAMTFDDENSVLKILGLIWCPSFDCFSFSVNPKDQICTKRTVLSDLARIFDVLGFLVPVTFKLKSMIQRLWSAGLKWDDQAPPDISETWCQYKQEMPLLSDLRIPRRVTLEIDCTYDIHSFCDASERGFAAVVYLRSIALDTGDIDVKFLCARSKVAPLKQITLPRLELCAAVLLADILQFVKSSLPETLSINKVWAWSDSLITLAWIASPPTRWKTFVSNRVSHIQGIIETDSWRHIRSEHNPSDCGTRGLSPAELVNHALWWAGPAWLRTPESEWPSTQNINKSLDDTILGEERKSFLSLLVTQGEIVDGLLERFSSVAKIRRIIAHICRFAHNARNTPTRRDGVLTSSEISEASIILIKCIQAAVFDEVLDKLATGKPISKELRKLNPFVDNKGVLRVGGRLRNSNLRFERKHPALLPRKHRLTDLIIAEAHIDNLHPGLQQVHHLIAQNFWILSAKRAIRHVLSNCNQCYRANPKPMQPLMGELPASRVQQLKSFQCAGVDYCGPFTTAVTRGRGTRTTKSYICLFVCFTTKAIHIELASNLTTEAFVAALKRFVARRGRCTKIFCDNGTNFVGAHRQLKEVMQAGCEQENIDFSFIPPSAPHMGGLWERSNRSVKTHLHRVIGNQILTFEEFYTLLVQIEAVLNSRPLYPISSDPNDLDVLTPGHFLTLAPLTAVPEEDVLHVPQNRLSRWQLLDKMHQDFWNRWHLEYLHTLNQRHKWHKDTAAPALGTLVLIKDDQSPPLQWKLGRITELHPGRDGISRVATIRTKQGLIKRPLVKLCPLPSQ